MLVYHFPSLKSFLSGGRQPLLIHSISLVLTGMSRRRSPPSDMTSVRKSRAAFVGAVTKALDKLKAVKSTEQADILLINTKDIDRILSALERTENGFLQTLEDGQLFVPEDDETGGAFLLEEEAAAESFHSKVSATRDLAEQLLAIKGVLDGLADFRNDLTALQVSLEDKPESNQTSAFRSLENLFNSLRTQWKGACLTTAHPVKSELDACKKAMNNLEADITSAKEKSDSHSTITSSSSKHGCCSSGGRSDLPTIKVPEFHGDIMEWSSFWSNFESTIDSRKELTNAKKLHYLRMAIKDPDIQLMLHSPIETPDRYLKVVEELKLRFDRTKDIHKHIVRNLLGMDIYKHNQTELRRLADLFQRTTDSLKATKFYDSDYLLSSILYMHLTPKTQTMWDQSTRKDKGIPTVSAFIKYLQDLSLSLPPTTTSSDKPVDNSAKKAPRKASPKQEPSSPRHKSNIHVVAPSPSYKWDCALCRPDKHPLHVCPKWSAYTMAQRMEHIQLKKLCSNCLAGGHVTSACKSTYRCRECNQPHHTTIHQQSSSITPINSTTVQSHQVPDALMTTAQVLLIGPRGQTLKARALIDSGAGLSLVSRRVAQLLDLPLEPSKLHFSAVQGAPCKPANFLTSLVISPLQNKDKKIVCKPAVVQMVTCDLPPEPVHPVTDLPHLMGLELADTTYHLPGRIDILLGADLAPQIMVKRVLRSGAETEPIAQATQFGWIISGPVQRKNTSTSLIPTHHHQLQASEPELIHLLKQFWYSEEPEEPETPLSLVEEQVQQHYANHVVYSPSELRYQVTLPRRPDMKPLGDSRTQALSRFLSNEKSVLRRKIWEPFQKVVQSYLDLGHAKPVPASDHLPPTNFYLPMHAVFKDSSTSTKLRVVFDGSATTTTGTSLNQALLVGPTIQPTLSNILLKFRLLTFPRCIGK